jgi:hypothetical protein
LSLREEVTRGCARVRDEELRELRTSPGCYWEEDKEDKVGGTEESRNVYKILARNPDRKMTLRRPGREWEDSYEMGCE